MINIYQSDEIECGMPNLSNHNAQHAQLSWLQSSNGEWLYFLDDNMVNEGNLAVVEQDYIWLVSQATAAHKISGYRIAHETIEMFIEQLSGVNQAIVFGVPHEQKGNAVHVYVELAKADIELSTLANAINAKLAGCFGEFVAADMIKFTDQLPAIKNKDISRKILKYQKIAMNFAA